MQPNFDSYGQYLTASLGNVGQAEHNLVPRAFTYVFERSLTALQSLPNLRLTVDGDAPFAIRALARTKTGDFKFRLQDAEGRFYSSGGTGGTGSLVRDDCIFGDGSLPYLLSPAIIIAPSNSITFDLEDVSNANNLIHIAFIGHKLYRAAQ